MNDLSEAEALGGCDAGLHVAIIMDGNGRWALTRGQPRIRGHEAGAGAVRRIVEAAPGLGIKVLTLFAFSSDNWKRPPQEVYALMRLFGFYLAAETNRCIEKGVRLVVIGRRDRLPAGLLRAVERAEAITVNGTFLLRIAIDYSSRDAIIHAFQRVNGRGGQLSRELFSQLLGDACHDGAAPDVDILIRTGGEKRLSDFLLWECAYAELVFSDLLWPDFGAEDLASAIHEFQARERRFGTIPDRAPRVSPASAESMRSSTRRTMESRKPS